jgi:GntR family transcriptional regulator
MNIVLTGDSDSPIYKQIIDQIGKQILMGNMLPGSQLPSIRQLARDMRVSVITTKKAYEELDRTGLIKTIPGKGCFVSTVRNGLLEEQRLRDVEKKTSVSHRDSREIWYRQRKD